MIQKLRLDLFYLVRTLFQLQDSMSYFVVTLGTSKGLIFETEIVLEGDKFFTSSLEQYWRQVRNYLLMEHVLVILLNVVFLKKAAKLFTIIR